MNFGHTLTHARARGLTLVGQKKSNSGVLIRYGDDPIFVTSSLHKSVSLNSADARYIALSNTARNIVWLLKALNEILVPQGCTLVHKDSNCAINYTTEEPAKHFLCREDAERGNSYVFNLVTPGTIDISGVSNGDIEAYPLAKSMPAAFLSMK